MLGHDHWKLVEWDGKGKPVIYIVLAKNKDRDIWGQSYNRGHWCKKGDGQIWEEWGLILFNRDACWTEGEATESCLNSTIIAAHELGHQLRLAHSSNEEDVMYSFPVKATKLTDHDIKEANASASNRFTCEKGKELPLYRTESPSWIPQPVGAPALGRSGLLVLGMLLGALLASLVIGRRLAAKVR